MAIVISEEKTKELGPVYACCGKLMRQYPKECGCPPPNDPQSVAVLKGPETRTAEAMEAINEKLGAILDRLMPGGSPKKLP